MIKLIPLHPKGILGRYPEELWLQKKDSGLRPLIHVILEDFSGAEIKLEIDKGSFLKMKPEKFKRLFGSDWIGNGVNCLKIFFNSPLRSIFGVDPCWPPLIPWREVRVLKILIETR